MKFLGIKQLATSLLSVFIFSTVTACYAQNIPPAEYPIFKELNPKSQVIGVLDTKNKFQILETRENCILNEPASSAHASGLKYYRDCLLVSQNNITGWIIDGITVKDKTLLVDFKINPKVLPSLFVSLIISIILLITLIAKYTKVKKWAQFIEDKHNIFLIIFFLLLLRITMVLNVLFNAGTFFVGTDDVEGYFQTGQAIFSTWDFTQCRYLVGHSFLVGLFSEIFGLDSWQEMVLPFSYFSALFIGSLVGILIYVLAYLLFHSKKAAFITLLIYVFYPFLIQVNHTRGIFSRDFIAIPLVQEYSIRLYYWTALVGFNALSDMSNMCFILGLFTLGLWGYPLRNEDNRRDYMYNYPLLLGILFGFSGSIRPSNIYFLPFIMYIVMQNTVNWRNIKYWQALNKLCFLAIGTIIGFSPQILANYLQDGNIFTLPYHLFHSDQLQQGFELSFLSTGGGMIFNGSSLLFSLALAGIFFARREVRFFAVFWIIPLLFFYCGYFGVSNVVRFILPILPMIMILAQQSFRRFPIACITTLLLIYLFKSQYFESIHAEMGYIMALSFALFLSGIGFIKSSAKKHLQQNFLVCSIIMFSQILIVISSLEYGQYAFLLYFVLMIAACLLKLNLNLQQQKINGL